MTAKSINIIAQLHLIALIGLKSVRGKERSYDFFFTFTSIVCVKRML